MSDDKTTPSDPRFKVAFDAYVKAHWGGWTEYAKVHTQSSGALDRAAFFEGWIAGRRDVNDAR